MESRAARTRSMSAAGLLPILIFTSLKPASIQPLNCCRSSASEYEVNPPLPYALIDWCARPRRSATLNWRSRALRSQRALSTAEIAIEHMPGRPRFRIDRTILDHISLIFRQLLPVRLCLRCLSMRFAVAMSAKE